MWRYWLLKQLEKFIGKAGVYQVFGCFFIVIGSLMVIIYLVGLRAWIDDLRESRSRRTPDMTQGETDPEGGVARKPHWLFKEIDREFFQLFILGPLAAVGSICLGIWLLW